MSVVDLADLLLETERRGRRDRANECQRRRRAEPEVRARELKSCLPGKRRKRAGQRATPEFLNKERARSREAARKRYMDPAFRAREQERSRARGRLRRADPDTHALDLASQRRRMQDPWAACRRCAYGVSKRGTAAVSREQLFGILKGQRFRCAVTGLPLDFRHQGKHPLQPSVDHIIPVGQGGTNALDNLRWVIWAYNDARQMQEHDHVLAEIFRPSDALRARLEAEAPDYVREAA